VATPAASTPAPTAATNSANSAPGGQHCSPQPHSLGLAGRFTELSPAACGATGGHSSAHCGHSSGGHSGGHPSHSTQAATAATPPGGGRSQRPLPTAAMVHSGGRSGHSVLSMAAQAAQPSRLGLGPQAQLSWKDVVFRHARRWFDGA
jgi:hypothetical protein